MKTAWVALVAALGLWGCGGATGGAGAEDLGAFETVAGDIRADTAPGDLGVELPDGAGTTDAAADLAAEQVGDQGPELGEDLALDTPQDTLWNSCAPACPVPAGVVWLALEGGSFQMGCSPEDGSCAEHENPAHQVTLPAFEIMETEVTEGQYLELVGSNPSFVPSGAEYPVESLTWLEAVAFCEAIGGRLPTEAEWEYAARGGSSTKYYCGDDSACAPDIGWVDTNSEGAKHPVKLKTPNDFGLYDSTGNVWEWVQDWYAADYYAGSPSLAPAGPETGTERCFRGGSFRNLGSARSSARNKAEPLAAFDTLGFRCARDPQGD